MTDMSSIPKTFAALATCLALCAPINAHAEDGAGKGKRGSGSESARERAERKQNHGLRITPYIEAAQVVNAELSPGNEVLTYSRLAAGVDVSAVGRRNAVSASLRYERSFGWGRKAGDGDVISGVARGYGTITPGLKIDAGALATRSKVEGSGASVIGSVVDSSASTQVYSLYAGPTLSTHAGNVKIDGAYRLGYTRVESPDAVLTAPGQPPVDIFDDSIVHAATLHAGTKPGDVLPVGLGIGGGYYREDISNLDQRVEDKNLRADVSVPLTMDLALVAGVGYENVRISSRDALRDAGGLPVVGKGGRFVTDKSAPRKLAYDVSGLTWDAGVIWRPSRRTALEAHVGKRYGSTSYFGNFAYAPSDRSSLNVSVYDSVAGFGGQVNRALVALPTEFQANRNVLTGDVTGCVAALEGSNCLSNALGSVRSSTFRGRGVMANYNMKFGRFTAGVGAGHDRRKFIAAPGTVLAAANGVVDENTWLAGYLNTRIGQRGTLSTNVYANWFQSGDGLNGDTSAIGASTAYGHSLTNHLTATAAFGIESVSREGLLDDNVSASALVGVRYSF